MTMATLSHVHTSPRKPCASAPRSRSSGTLARCSSLRRGRAPGAGRRFKASAPPPSRTRFIHWLTAPLLTPRASAMRCWDHPSCLSSKALRRLPSRQSVAPLESELSISGSYHQRLAISAEVSKCFTGGAQSLIVPARPAVLREPREGALHNPAPWQDFKAPAWKQLLPVDLPALFRELLRPYPRDLLWRRL